MFEHFAHMRALKTFFFPKVRYKLFLAAMEPTTRHACTYHFDLFSGRNNGVLHGLILSSSQTSLSTQDRGVRRVPYSCFVKALDYHLIKSFTDRATSFPKFPGLSPRKGFRNTPSDG